MDRSPPADFEARLLRADAAYQPTPGYDEWAPESPDLGAWDEAAEVLARRRGEAARTDFDDLLVEQLRAAAVDTGAIEGLYTADRGFTLSVARQVISLDQAEVEKGEAFRRNYEAQLDAFHLALDIATGGQPISEALIRRLHEVTCAGQGTYRVLTSVGIQEHRLEPGT